MSDVIYCVSISFRNCNAQKKCTYRPVCTCCNCKKNPPMTWYSMEQRLGPTTDTQPADVIRAKVTNMKIMENFAFLFAYKLQEFIKMLKHICLIIIFSWVWLLFLLLLLLLGILLSFFFMIMQLGHCRDNNSNNESSSLRKFFTRQPSGSGRYETRRDFLHVSTITTTTTTTMGPTYDKCF